MHLATFISDNYDLRGQLSELPSYSDKNYLLTTNAGKKYVVKITAASTELQTILLENDAIGHIEKKKLSIQTPKLIKSLNQQTLLDYYPDSSSPTNHSMQASTIRVLSWVEGSLYSELQATDRQLHESLGELVAQMTLAFSDFVQPTAKRVSDWDIAQLDRLQPKLNYYHSHKKELLSKHLSNFIRQTKVQLNQLPQQVIHNDANDNNLVVNKVNDSAICSGIFDFGDIVFSYRVCDLAVAMAYAMMNQEHPLTVAKHIVKGYQKHLAISKAEIDCLLGLIQARLVQSLLNSGQSYSESPDNQYLIISAAPAWDLLKTLDSITHQKFLSCILEQESFSPHNAC